MNEAVIHLGGPMEINRFRRKSKDNPEPYTKKQLKRLAKVMGAKDNQLNGVTKLQLFDVLRGLGVPTKPSRRSRMNSNNHRLCTKNTTSIQQLLKIATNKYKLPLDEIKFMYSNLSYSSKMTNKLVLCRAIDETLKLRSHMRNPILNTVLSEHNYEHPISSASNDVQDIYAKMQLGIPLENWEDKMTNSNENWKKTYARVVLYEYMRTPKNEINRLPLEQLELLRNIISMYPGLPKPSSSWKPRSVNNANNLIKGRNTMQNDILLHGVIPNKGKAVYLKNDVINRKIQAVYDLNGLKTWLMLKSKSPTTKRDILTWNSVRKVPEKILRNSLNKNK